MDYKNALNSMQDGIVIIDKTGHIQFINKAYERFAGCTLDEARGRALTDIRPGALMPKTIARGESRVCVLRREGDQDYFASMYPIYEDGEVVGGISIVTYLESAQFFAEAMKSLKQKEHALKKRMSLTNGTRYTFSDMVFGSPEMAQCVESAKRIAGTVAPILLQGESGCGKEVFAQSIHNESDRQEYPFVAVNCAALNKSVLESELFGYEPGAFTGARKEGKIGLFEAAEHGTLFLDEISEMDVELQSKLLRALQEQKIRRVGGTKEIPIDVRVISACNVDIQKYIDDGKFRLDLYYRLAVIPLRIPPLRERKGDLRPLVNAHLRAVSIYKKQLVDIADDAMDALEAYHWPGNVRELNNVLEYAALLCQGSLIHSSDLPAVFARQEHSGAGELPLAERVRAFEKEEIKKALGTYGNTVDGKRKAAKALGISLASLYNKMKILE